MPLRNGDVFAGYRIIRLLGSGGMGEVYLAQHPRLPRRDALKILPADVSSDGDFRQRFEREADLASTLWHPNIVGVHDRGEHDDQLWISMDFVDGLDAARLLAKKYPSGMPADAVIRIVTAVAGALDYAHKHGLVHRDVKPANIMITHPEDPDEQRVLLTDFGIARDVSEISGLTATNMTVGTVSYAAPEQLLGDEIDGRTDQYALAATAYHLLTGSQLFPHSNPAVVISRHLSATPPALTDTKPNLSNLDSALGSALAKSRDDRFPSCSDFARALAAKEPKFSAVSATSVTKPATAPARKPLGTPRTSNGRPRSPTAAKPIRQLSAVMTRGDKTAIAALAAVLFVAAGGVVWVLLATQPWETSSSKAGTATAPLSTSGLAPIPESSTAAMTSTSNAPVSTISPVSPTASSSQIPATASAPPPAAADEGPPTTFTYDPGGYINALDSAGLIAHTDELCNVVQGICHPKFEDGNAALVTGSWVCQLVRQGEGSDSIVYKLGHGEGRMPSAYNAPIIYNAATTYLC